MTRTTKMKKAFCCLLTMLMLLPLSSNLTHATEDAENSEIQYTIDQVVAEHQATTAAMSVSVFDNNQVLFEHSYGYINLTSQTENNPNTVFEWGSAGKLLVYVSVLQLAEQGLLDLDADIHTLLPDGFLTKLTYDDPITMIHLLNHTAGFQEAAVELFTSMENVPRSLEESLRLLQPPQIFRPGTYSGYSNFGTTLAAYIVELISEKPFHQYVHANIFSPLGMTQTALAPDLMDNPWVREQRALIYCYSASLDPLGNLSLMIQWYPAGMATGTISDFRRFGQGLLVDDEGLIPLFQYPETITKFHQATLTFSDGVTGRNYHGFLSEPWLEGHVIGHGGNTAGMSAQLAIDIENNWGTVIMTNQAGEMVYCRRMLGEIFGRRDLTQFDNSANAGTVSGLYRSTRTFQRGIFRLGGIMGVLPIIGEEINEGAPIVEVAPGVYFMTDPAFLIFATADEEGRVHSLSMIFQSFVRSSWSGFIFELVILLLFIIAGLYGLIGLIKILVKKLRKKEQVLVKVRGGVHVGSLLALVNTVLMLLLATLTMGISRNAVIIHGVLSILSLLMILFFVGTLFFQIKKGIFLNTRTSLNEISTDKLSQLKLVKKQKRQMVYTTIMGSFVILNLFYWQMWMFWV